MLSSTEPTILYASSISKFTLGIFFEFFLSFVFFYPSKAKYVNMIEITIEITNGRTSLQYSMNTRKLYI